MRSQPAMSGCRPSRPTWTTAAGAGAHASGSRPTRPPSCPPSTRATSCSARPVLLLAVPALEVDPDLVDLSFEIGAVMGVVDDIRRQLAALLVVGLRGHPGLGVGAIDTPCLEPLQADVPRGLDDDHGLIRALPGLLRLGEERHVEDDDGIGWRFDHAARELVIDGGGGDRLEVTARLVVTEHELRQGAPLESPVGIEDALAEPLDELLQRRLPRLDDGSRYLVGVDDDRGPRRKQFGDGGLTGSDPPGEPHADTFSRSRPPVRRV